VIRNVAIALVLSAIISIVFILFRVGYKSTVTDVDTGVGKTATGNVIVVDETFCLDCVTDEFTFGWPLKEFEGYSGGFGGGSGSFNAMNLTLNFTFYTLVLLALGYSCSYIKNSLKRKKK